MFVQRNIFALHDQHIYECRACGMPILLHKPCFRIVVGEPIGLGLPPMDSTLDCSVLGEGYQYLDPQPGGRRLFGTPPGCTFLRGSDQLVFVSRDDTMSHPASQKSCGSIMSCVIPIRICVPPEYCHLAMIPKLLTMHFIYPAAVACKRIVRAFKKCAETRACRSQTGRPSARAK